MAEQRQLLDTDLAAVRAMVETPCAAKATHDQNDLRDTLRATAPSQAPVMLPRMRTWLRTWLARL